MGIKVTAPYTGEWCVDSHDQNIADAFREELDHGWSAEHILSILCTEFFDDEDLEEVTSLLKYRRFTFEIDDEDILL
jgi:type I restriction-modification system DNA methylase subunit